MTKLVCTILYLIGSVLFFYIATKQNKLVLSNIQAGVQNAFSLLFLSNLLLVLSFVQFWLLTRMFPIYLILLLAAASIVAFMINQLLEAIIGSALPEKRKKIQVIDVIRGFEIGLEHSKMILLFILAAILMLLASWIGSLYVFWLYPIAESDAKILIALFHFTLPQVFRILFSIAFSWPRITSKFIDNDFRNAHLTKSFTSVLVYTIHLSFPVWLFKSEINSLFGRLPPFWLLLAIPLILFLLSGVFPFLIGLLRSRSRVRSLLIWRRKWMRELLNRSRLPAGGLRSSAIDSKRQQLEDEICKRISEHRLLQIYQKILTPITSSQEESLPALAAESPPAPEGLLPNPQPEEDAPIARQEPPAQLRRFGEYLLRPQLSGQNFTVSQNQSINDVFAIVRENANQMTNWDIRFSELEKLMEVHHVCTEVGSGDISRFIAGEIKAVDEELAGPSEGRKLIPGAIPSGIITLLASVMVALLRAYNDEIIKLGRNLLLGSE